MKCGVPKGAREFESHPLRQVIFMPRIVDLRKQSIKESVPSPVETRPVLTVPTSTPIPARTENESLTPREFFWEAPLSYHNPKKKYLTSTITAGLLIGAGAMFFFHQNSLTAIFMIVSALVLMLYTNKKPTMSKITINELGVAVDNQLYAYKELKSFWIDYVPGNIKELSLESKKWYLPYTKISFENQNPIELRNMLTNFLPEREHEVSLIDIISKKMGL